MSLPVADLSRGANNRAQRAAEVLPQAMAQYNSAQEITGKRGDPTRSGPSTLAEGIAVGAGLAANAIAPGFAPAMAVVGAGLAIGGAATYAASTLQTPEEFGSNYSGGSSEYVESDVYCDVLGGACDAKGNNYSASGYAPPMNVRHSNTPQHLGYYSQAGQGGDNNIDPRRALELQDEAGAMIRAAQTALHDTGHSALANQVDRDLKQGERFANPRPQMGMPAPSMA